MWMTYLSRVSLENHVDDLDEIFDTLCKYHMKLNLAKYTFRIILGKSFGFMVSQRGIKANPKKM